MSPDLFRRVRAALGFSVEGMARALGLDRNSGARTVRRWEAGTSAITGPVRLACVKLLTDAGFDQRLCADDLYALAHEIEEEIT